MTVQDWFVGTVAVVLGLCLLLTAVFQWEWTYQLDKARQVENLWGRSAARCCFAALGVSLVALGWFVIQSPRAAGAVNSRVVTLP